MKRILAFFANLDMTLEINKYFNNNNFIYRNILIMLVFIIVVIFKASLHELKSAKMFQKSYF